MNEMNKKYSILMSVYCKEKAEFLWESMESVYNQTVPADDFVLVCDGPLNRKLDKVIEQMKSKFGDRIQVIRLKKNLGLGNALNEGLKYCKHELVARMDSDDISMNTRCERQLSIFDKNPRVDILSGTILEFQKNPECITEKRELPEKHEDICQFAHKRNPFNHPAIMLKKSAVEAVGGYQETYPMFEDYYLWIRMLQNGSVGYNLKNPVLYMRTSSDFYLRRGGLLYAKRLLRFRGWLYRTGWSTGREYVEGAILHALVCLLPNGIRKTIYKLLHR